VAGRCECQRPCNCCTTGTSTVAVVGSGSGGNCFQPSVRFSSDDGNRARVGGDGGVYADLCAVTPSGDPVALNETGCLVLPAPCILDQGGDPLEPDEDGCLQLPANTPPAYGCGLDQDGEGTLIVKTSGIWPPTALSGAAMVGAVSDGGAIMCDPLTGELRGLPDHTTVHVSASETLLAPTLEPVDPLFITAASAAVVLTNPSPARRMLVARQLTMLVDLVNGANGGAIVSLQERVDGGGWTTVREVRYPEAITADVRSMLVFSSDASATLVANASQTVETRVRVDKTGAGTDPVLVSARVGVRLVGVTE
jgi:hypothetical protein